MDNFTKCPEVYAIPNQETSTVADALVTNFFCRFGVPMLLHRNQDRNFEPRLIQLVLERPRVNKTRTTPLHLQSDGMVERHVKTIEEHLRKVVSTHQRYWDERIPIFLLAYRASTREATGVTSANMVFGREFCLPFDLLFGAPSDVVQSTTDYTAALVERLHEIHHFAYQHLKLAIDLMKARYDQLVNLAGFQMGDRVWMYRPARWGENRPSCRRAGKAHTSSSSESTTLYIGFSAIPGQR